MENASKALIIAGAILISILLISVGVMVMNSANGLTGQAEDTMHSSQIQAFNADLLNYEGTRRGSDVRQLYSVYQGKKNSTDESLNLEWSGDYGSALKSTALYTVSFEYASDGDYKGYINKIIITKGTTGGTTSGS